MPLQTMAKLLILMPKDSFAEILLFSNKGSFLSASTSHDMSSTVQRILSVKERASVRNCPISSFVIFSGLCRLNKIVRLPLSFFSSQPTGRLLNRFARDTEAGTPPNCFSTLLYGRQQKTKDALCLLADELKCKLQGKLYCNELCKASGLTLQD